MPERMRCRAPVAAAAALPAAASASGAAPALVTVEVVVIRGSLKTRAGSPLPAGRGRKSGCPRMLPGQQRLTPRQPRERAWPYGSRCASRCRCRRPGPVATTKCRGLRRYPPGPCERPSNRSLRRRSGKIGPLLRQEAGTFDVAFPVFDVELGVADVEVTHHQGVVAVFGEFWQPFEH